MTAPHDELDMRIRALEAERLRPVPGTDLAKDAERTQPRVERKPHNLAESADALLSRMRRDFPQWHPEDRAKSASTSRKRRPTTSPHPRPQNSAKGPDSGPDSEHPAPSDPQG